MLRIILNKQHNYTAIAAFIMVANPLVAKFIGDKIHIDYLISSVKIYFKQFV